MTRIDVPLATLRHTRYQAAIVHEGSILLVCCAFRDGPTVWMLPGGGREESEDELACVAREVLEETGLIVQVERQLLDCPAQPTGGSYERWRTFLCSVIGGQAAPGGGEGDDARLVAIKWLSLVDEAWPAEIGNDPVLAPQLRAIRYNLRDSRNFALAPPTKRWQFSPRAALLGLFGLSVVLAIASQFPRESAFAASMTLLMFCPIAFVSWARFLFVRDRSAHKRRSTSPVIDWLLRPIQLLWQSDNAPSPLAGTIIALLSTLTLAGLWPLLREVGGTLTLIALQPIPDYTYSLSDATHSMVEAFSSPRYWFRLWQWELWAVGRWWLLFGTLTLVWLAAAPFGLRAAQKTRMREALARLLAFAPWFIVLEIAFLAGVWVQSPSTVPEPSTGFVVGIYSWDLWHWDCWLNHEWLIRGAVPTFVAGLVFFRRVLGWWWFAAVVAALCLIPIALTLSIASTVAFQRGFPPLF